ncbi:MAG: ThiF family adenylyltransferase [Gammaproteobacteria bacterium]|nr:ThiF family adenylyltransferase [Gammaproteobacteria bacterium]
MSDFEEKFGSLARVYGEEMVQFINGLHICVVGIGGVENCAPHNIKKKSIGKITLVDGDTISRGNTNRQIHTLESTIGQSKAETMKQRILDINPECEVLTIEQYIDGDNLRDILERGYDCVIDAIDAYKSKASIIYCCKRNKIPVVTTGGAGGLLDPTQIQVSDLSSTWNDPLAAKVRSWLRYKYGFTSNKKYSFGVPCIYSIEQQRYPDKEGKVGYCKPGTSGLSLDCAFGYGSSVAVTASFGLATAAKTIDHIARKKKIIIK